MAGYYSAGTGGFRQRRHEDEVDPMSSMGNMGDIMLVFACGLMVALVVAWNVDLGKFTQVQMDESTEVNDVEQITEMLYGEGNAFVEKGTVYQDPATGKYYLVEEGAGTGASTEANISGGDGANGSGSSAGNAGSGGNASTGGSSGASGASGAGN